MSGADTRAAELAAAEWRDEGTIKELTRDPATGWVSILTTSSIGFGIAPKFAGHPMAVGETVALCGGGRVQGVRVGGRLIFFKTEADLEADHQKFLDELAAKRRAEYEANKDRWRQEVATLEPLLRARMERFIRKGGGFELFFLDMGSYELFCCTEAVKFAEYFRRVFEEKGITTHVDAMPELRRFESLDPQAQKALVPYDSGHSGNTFGGALMLGARVALGLEV